MKHCKQSYRGMSRVKLTVNSSHENMFIFSAFNKRRTTRINQSDAGSAVISLSDNAGLNLKVIAYIYGDSCSLSLL